MSAASKHLEAHDNGAERRGSREVLDLGRYGTTVRSTWDSSHLLVTCRDCGCAVEHTDAARADHDRFHNRFERLAKRPSPNDRIF